MRAWIADQALRFAFWILPEMTCAYRYGWNPSADALAALYNGEIE